ncbi:MAG TPA: prolyl aminopeptidase, partial [Rhodospirillales bacterium]|nr:prolyl aminopeptidase [Rhodospirillales bacterium]
LHGGPGSGCSPQQRRFFDPQHYRIILFDQRGAGLSTPYAGVEANTTAHLIDDLERLRQHLKIGKWLLFGGSWGSTLALVYAMAHRDRCLGLVLRGIFLASQAELDWFMDGMGKIYPEARRNFVQFLPALERADPLSAYHRRLIDPDPDTHLAAAASWGRYETQCSTLRPGPSATSPPPTHETSIGGNRGRWKSMLAIARIEAHYFVNNMFLEPGQILDNIGKLCGLPVAIVQGRYDIVCPIATADLMVRALKLANAGCKDNIVRYSIIDDAGHSAMEPGIRQALIAACDSFKSL